MPASTFPCPHCSAPLRVRDRRYAGTRVNCPDCGSLLLIVAEEPDGFSARPADGESDAESASPVYAPVREPRREWMRPLTRRLAAWGGGAAETARRGQRWLVDRTRALLHNPVAVAWIVAGAGTLMFVLALLPGTQNSTDRPAGVGEPDGGGSSGLRADRQGAASGAAVAERPDDDVESRLGALGGRISEYREEHEHFPRGTVDADDLPPGERLSWLAALAAADPEREPQPVWDHSWRDPVNERFIRQRIPGFQNPGMEQLVDDEGFPATHFAGVAGVGADAPKLPADHPRAGLFGFNRTTTAEDVKDGTSQTMMVAGVTKDNGAWAAGGRATVRPFTKTPYINGPDGFGTGQPDGMHVLMADGSVRFLSKETDPSVIRHMAAMADGLPPDSSAPGEPGELAETSPPDEPQAAETGQEREPSAPGPPPLPPGNVSQLVTPEPPQPVNVEAALAQPILRFEQKRSAPFEDLLLQVEEMAGVPVRFEKGRAHPPEEIAGRRVTLALENTTVGEILRALLKRVGLRYVVESDGIRIEPAPADAAD